MQLKLPTFGFIYSYNHHALISSYSDKFIDGADASSREFAQHDHPFNVVVLQEHDVGTHLRYRANIYHHNVLKFGVAVLVESTRYSHLQNQTVKWVKYREIYKLLCLFWSVIN